jgi:hypothetical protein
MAGRLHAILRAVACDKSAAAALSKHCRTNATTAGLHPADVSFQDGDSTAMQLQHRSTCCSAHGHFDMVCCMMFKGATHSQVLQALFDFIHDVDEGWVHVAQQGQCLCRQDAGVGIGGAWTHQQARGHLQAGRKCSNTSWWMFVCNSQVKHGGAIVLLATESGQGLYM